MSHERLAGSSIRTGVGATLRFLGSCDSSFSDSLVSLLPNTLPLTELGLLIIPDIGV